MSEPRLARLARATVALVLGDWESLAAVRRAAPAGEPDRAWREAILQTHLFAGFPRLVEGCEVLDGAGGLGPPDEQELEAPGPLDTDAHARAGAPLFETIYADRADAVRARLASFHPHLARWIAEHAYGRVLARPGLEARERELLAVVALVATGQDRQLASHARGAVRCGATREEVIGIVQAVGSQIETGRLARGLAVLRRFAVPD